MLSAATGTAGRHPLLRVPTPTTCASATAGSLQIITAAVRTVLSCVASRNRERGRAAVLLACRLQIDTRCPDNGLPVPGLTGEKTALYERSARSPPPAEGCRSALESWSLLCKPPWAAALLTWETTPCNKPRLQGARDGRRPSAGPATRRRSLRSRRATDPVPLGTRTGQPLPYML